MKKRPEVSPSAAPIPRPTRLLFIGTMAVLPLLVLLALEGILRLGARRVMG